jgi:hypothetical protein
MRLARIAGLDAVGAGQHAQRGIVVGLGDAVPRQPGAPDIMMEIGG